MTLTIGYWLLAIGYWLSRGAVAGKAHALKANG